VLLACCLRNRCVRVDCSFACMLPGGGAAVPCGLQIADNPNA